MKQRFIPETIDEEYGRNPDSRWVVTLISRRRAQHRRSAPWHAGALNPEQRLTCSAGIYPERRDG
jgi:hypothetical protein